MTALNKKIFLLIVSFLFFIFTEPILAKMNRAPANPIPPIPSSYKIRHLASDIEDVQRWLKDGLCEPTPLSDSPIEKIYSTIQEIQKITPK